MRQRMGVLDAECAGSAFMDEAATAHAAAATPVPVFFKKSRLCIIILLLEEQAQSGMR
jgi:hypothetical protein